MMFNEIAESIMEGENRYETERGIETEKVINIFNGNGFAFFIGMKSDKTKTLFIAFRKTKYSDSSWFWWCPSQPQAEHLIYDFPKYFNDVEEENKKEKLHTKLLDVRTDHIISLNDGRILKTEVKDMDADKYYGEYLKAEDVKQEVNVTIQGVNLETIDGEQKLVIQLLGFNKRLVLNKTNKDRLKKRFGTSETDEWINKQFTLTTEQVQYKGEEVPALRVKITTEEAPASS